MYFNQIDEKRASVLMSKLDGLVLKLCIDKFAKYDLQQKAKGKIQKLDTGIEEKTRMFNEYSARQKEATENYTTVLKRAIRYARDEAGERLFLELKALFPDIVHHTLPEGFKDVGQYWAYVKRQV